MPSDRHVEDCGDGDVRRGLFDRVSVACGGGRRASNAELAIDASGKCTMHTPNPRVQLDRVVRLKNSGDVSLTALVELSWGGMAAPAGGDLEPGQHISVKLARSFVEEDPDAPAWSIPIVCKRSPWESDVELDRVGKVHVSR